MLRLARFVPSLILAAASLACAPSVPAVVSVEPPPGAEPVIVEAAPVRQPARTCERAGAEGILDVVPDQAQLLISINPRELMAAGAWVRLEMVFAKDSEWVQAMAIFDGCGLPASTWERLVIGVTRSEEYVLAGVAPGAGRDENARCLIEAIQRANGEEISAVVTPSPDLPSLRIIEFSDGRAYLIDDDAIAIATLGLADLLGDRLECVGPPAFGGPLTSWSRVLDPSATIWLAGAGWPEVESVLSVSAPPLAFVVAARFADGVDLQLEVLTSDPASAEAMAREAQGLVDGLRPMVPPGLVRAVEDMSVVHEGDAMQIGLSITGQEWDALLSL